LRRRLRRGGSLKKTAKKWGKFALKKALPLAALAGLAYLGYRNRGVLGTAARTWSDLRAGRTKTGIKRSPREFAIPLARRTIRELHF
jgi:hypothetical protein